MKNSELAKILREIGMYLEMQEVAFKPRAYEKAAYGVESLEEDIAEFYKKNGEKGLEALPGVGKSIAEKIIEFLKTGKVKEHQKLKKQMPVDLDALTSVEGIGPKMALKLYKRLKIKDLKDLEKAARAGKIHDIPGFGEKTEKNILQGIEFVKQSGGRFVLGFILPMVREIEGRLRDLGEVENVVVAGSIRRWKETVGDADVLIVSKKPKPVMDFFVSMPEVVRVYAHGETKSAVKLRNGLDVDLRVVPKESFGAALNYFTGSKDHNVALRELAMRKGWKLNEYGLFDADSRGRKRGFTRKEKMIAGRNEEELYEALGMQYIPPEMRENTGEIELALRQARGKLGELPKLIEYDDLRGDLQVQTDWTDGVHSIGEMASEARKMGFQYIAVTDHTRSLAMTGGADERKLLKQMQEIDRLNKKFKGKPHILKGAEVNIAKDGSLDISDEVLAKLDVVGIAVHSHFNLSRKDQTERIKKAMSNPHANILFHPTGRIINRRKAIDVDIDEIIAHARKTRMILEIDAYPDRLDLKDEHIRKAVEAGVKLSVSSDAHSTLHMHYLEFGIAQARRGWAEKSDIVNTKSLRELLHILGREKRRL